MIILINTVSMRMNFIDFYTLLENNQIKNQVTNAEVAEMFKYYSRNTNFKNFFKKLNIYAVPLKENKIGFFVFGDYFSPVQVVKIIPQEDGNQVIEFRKPDNTSFADMAYMAPVFSDRITKQTVLVNTRYNFYLLDENRFRATMNWLTYLEKTSPEDFSKFLNDEEAQSVLIESPVDSNKVISSSYQNLVKTYNQKKAKQDITDNRSNRPGREGRDIIKFDDGWRWISLDAGGCRIEGDAAGHCGNGEGNPGENLLSLRDEQNRIHITMVVDSDKVTSEIKGVGNKKPKPYTHKYLVELFCKKEDVKGIGSAKWQAETNFELSDLSKEHIDKLIEAGFLNKRYRADAKYLEEMHEQEWYSVLVSDDREEFSRIAEEQHNIELYDYDHYSPDNNRLYLEHRSVPMEYETIQPYLKKFLSEVRYDDGIDVESTKNIRNKEFRNIFFKPIGNSKTKTIFRIELQNVIQNPEANAFTRHFKHLLLLAYQSYVEASLNKVIGESTLLLEATIPNKREANSQKWLYVNFYINPQDITDFEDKYITYLLDEGVYRRILSNRNETVLLEMLLQTVQNLNMDLHLFINCLDEVSALYPFYTKYKFNK